SAFHEVMESLTSLATVLPPEELAAFARERFPEAARQADLLCAITDGLQQRGELPGPGLTNWGNSIAAELLAKPHAKGWTIVIDPRSNAAPWTLRSRKLQDGREVELISSLDGA